MSVRISGKNMNVGEALNARIAERVAEMAAKYFGAGHSGHVTLEKSARGFSCDCSLHLDSGAWLQATAREHDPVLCFEAAADRIEKRLRRYKRRLRDRHPGREAAARDASYTVVAPPDGVEEIAENYHPAIVAESSTSIRTHTVAQAVMQLDMTDSPVLVFTNAGNGQMNVIYRRADGNIGWIDPKTGD